MPIYLVRWPDFSASLVRVRDEDDLIDALDQVVNPEGCEWSIHKGIRIKMGRWEIHVLI